MERVPTPALDTALRGDFAELLQQNTSLYLANTDAAEDSSDADGFELPRAMEMRTSWEVMAGKVKPDSYQMREALDFAVAWNRRRDAAERRLTAVVPEHPAAAAAMFGDAFACLDACATRLAQQQAASQEERETFKRVRQLVDTERLRMARLMTRSAHAAAGADR